MDSSFEPKSFEDRIRQYWNDHKSFAADPTKSADPFTIVIPPPNVTAPLHLGHALNNTLQDILIRYHRMKGDNTLWMPGTDHAGIATQTVVEKLLMREEGKRRTDYERGAFVEKCQAWKDEYEKRILDQLKAMGASCDWDRTRFTMDDMCARAVRAIFFKLFSDKLVYRGLRLVNWDPATQTVLADDELEDKKLDTHFWYLRYPLTEAVEIDGETIDYVVVGTTRPETMLGDTAVAINPRDPRASVLVGKKVKLPIVGREIPIVGDDYVVLPDPESSDEKARYSSGCLKVTPAHDKNDWDIGQRHDLEIINIMAPDASISNKHGFEDGNGTEAEQFFGMDRYDARKAIVKWFEDHGLLHEIRDYAHEVAHSYRSHVPVEPYLSRQWYVAVKQPIDAMKAKFGESTLPDTDVPANSLAGIALQPLNNGDLKFHPPRYASNYKNWLENLRDWPISRQLWWGHQIPIWRKDGSQSLSFAPEQAQVMEFDEGEDGIVSYACVAADQPDVEAALEQDGWVRDPDVLDTWFSSALWPFSTMGWPDKTPELEKYYPGSVLCTAREIITLWVSRMVMMGQYCLNDIPFTDVFIHALILDGKGKKMSKTAGNGIDPLVIIDSHGTDAMRYTLCSMTTLTQDARLPVDKITLPDGRTVNTSTKFDAGRKLCVKLWNATRFVLGQLENCPDYDSIDPTAHLADRWILSRLSDLIDTVTNKIEGFLFSEIADNLYHFLFDDYCDWYVEIAKARIANGETAPKAILAFVLDQFLRLFQPVAPFVTQVLWEELGKVTKSRGPGNNEVTAELCSASWPSAISLKNTEAEAQFALVQDLVRKSRNLRKTNNVGPRKPLTAYVTAGEATWSWLGNATDILQSQAALESLEFKDKVELSSDMGVIASGDCTIYLCDVVDTAAELKRLNKRLETLTKGINGVERKLGNAGFVNNAPAAVVEKERQRLEEMKSELGAVQAALNNLQAT